MLVSLIFLLEIWIKSQLPLEIATFVKKLKFAKLNKKKLDFVKRLSNISSVYFFSLHLMMWPLTVYVTSLRRELKVMPRDMGNWLIFYSILRIVFLSKIGVIIKINKYLLKFNTYEQIPHSKLTLMLHVVILFFFYPLLSLRNPRSDQQAPIKVLK